MFTREQFKELPMEDKLKVMELKAKFHKKKAAAMASMERIPKNGYNSHNNYYFAQESDVKDKIRPIMDDHGLSYSLDLISSEKGQPYKRGNGMWTDIKIEMYFEIIDTETGYFETFMQVGEASDNADKGIYKAYSNTIKYGLMNYFLIPTGDDVENVSPPDAAGSKPQNKNNGGQANKNNGSAPPISKRILNTEEELMEAAGVTKDEVRKKLRETFGKLPMYKEMDEQAAKPVLDKLNEWIKSYEIPIG